jgi:hypothetical protein
MHCAYNQAVKVAIGVDVGVVRAGDRRNCSCRRSKRIGRNGICVLILLGNCMQIKNSLTLYQLVGKGGVTCSLVSALLMSTHLQRCLRKERVAITARRIVPRIIRDLPIIVLSESVQSQQSYFAVLSSCHRYCL